MILFVMITGSVRCNCHSCTEPESLSLDSGALVESKESMSPGHQTVSHIQYAAAIASTFQVNNL